MKVTIPFYERFKIPMLSGRKTWTSRTKRYGEPTDTFEAFGQIFKITKVEEKSLQVVADHWYDEGCDSRDDFVELWNKIHYRKGYEPHGMVWVHRFKRITY